MFDIFEEIKGANRIGITGHEKPDGDCIGSCLSLMLYLKKRLPDSSITVFLQKPGYSFRNIPHINDIDSSFESDNVFDAFIVLDSVPERTGTMSMYSEAKKTINVDHHISNKDGSGMVNYVVPEASSTAELVYDIIDKSYIDNDIAALIYMGIAHDTGVFRYSNVAPKTMLSVAELLKYDYDFSTLIDETFFEKTFKQNVAQGRIVQAAKLYYDNKLIISGADKSFMQELDVTKADFEGVVEQLRITEGVVCAVLVYQKDEGLFKASFRSKTDEANVAAVAECFGGGGHVRAAGADIKANDFNEVVDRIVEAFKGIF